MNTVFAGFGDFVAVMGEANPLTNSPGYVALSFIYILIGLTVIGAFLNLVILRMIITNQYNDDGDSSAGSGSKKSSISTTENHERNKDGGRNQDDESPRKEMKNSPDRIVIGDNNCNQFIGYQVGSVYLVGLLMN